MRTPPAGVVFVVGMPGVKSVLAALMRDRATNDGVGGVTLYP
ncbi:MULTISPECIES: hypothetical protein [Deinococcus]|nr:MULTISPECIES: hypothetical protein [Deinococcus]